MKYEEIERVNLKEKNPNLEHLRVFLLYTYTKKKHILVPKVLNKSTSSKYTNVEEINFQAVIAPSLCNPYNKKKNRLI